MDPSSRPQLLQDNMASSDHHQTLESMLVCTKLAASVEKKPIRPADQQALKCPRCNSANTKFCYYNNYSLTQPRYFCKSCRRYWTKGGTLRNVPVGGGCRRNKRSSSSSCSSSSNFSNSSSKIIRSSQEQQHPNMITAINDHVHNTTTNALLSYNTNVFNDDSTDLSLAFARLQNGQLGFNQHLSYVNNGFVETPLMNGLQNVYYGGDNLGSVENVGGIGGNVSGEMGSLPYEDLMMSSSGATTAVKEEERNGRVLWGYPWQNVGDVDAAGRQSSWINGLGSANWHGLLNSPALM